MDRITQMLDTLTELSDEQVSELQTTIVSEFETVEQQDLTPQTVDTMAALAESLDTVRNEMSRREALAQELATRASEASARVHGGEEATTATADPETEEEEAPAAPAPVEEEDAMDGDTEAEEMSATEESEAGYKAGDAPEDEDDDSAEMSTASTDAETASELSTDDAVEATAAAEVPAEAEASVDVAEVEAPIAEATADVPAEATASVETPAEAEASVAEPEIAPSEQKEQATVTAAATGETLDFEAPADRRPQARETSAPVAITAGADIPGYTAGSTVKDMNEVAELMVKRLRAVRNVNGGNGEQLIVASITTEFPEERTLTTDPEANWAKVQNFVSAEAITAAGGHVAPYESRYEIFGVGTTVRPVRDSLARFQADRGGIRFLAPPKLSSYGNAVGVWTAANDAAETPSPAAKTSLTAVAGAETVVATDAVTLQLQFGNLATRAYPELIARHNELGLIQHAREAEQNLLSQITAASTAVTTTNLLGFGRDFLVQIGRAASAYRSRHRMEADAPLRVIIPSWVKDAMAADLAISMPGDNLLNAYAEIDGYIAARNVNLTVSLDQGVYGAQGAAALLEFPDTFVWQIFAEGSFLFLDGGTLDLGIIRDSTLVGTNDYKMFLETFEAVAFVGVESLSVTSTISINGAAAALRDTLGGVAAAVIEL